MRDELVTPPAEEPVTLAEAKAHLRVDSTAEDALISSLIVVARQGCETRLRRAIVTQTRDIFFDGWPGRLVAGHRRLREIGPLSPMWPTSQAWLAIELPWPKLQSVTSIAYTDVAGVVRTLDPSAYVVSTGTPGRVAPAFGTTWPGNRAQLDAVAIRYVCGYGAASAVPKCVKQAILMLVGHYFENREAVAVNVGANIMEMPLAVDALLAPEQFGGYV